MLATLIIIFREVIEAGLIVGIVLAATKGVPGRSLWVALGVLGGVIGAAILAVFAGGLSSLFQGSGQELFNATVLLIAVCMLTWHNVWMASHGREISQQMKAVGADVKIGAKSLAALAIVVGIAVLREGSEVVLFLYGILAQGGASASGMVTGGLLGVLAGAAVSAVIYLGLVAIPMKRLFAVTGALIALLAAGLAVQAMAFLQQAGVARFFEKPLWNTSSVVSDGSMVGRLLKTLIGYTDQPDGLQLIAWVAVIAAMFGLTKLVGRRHASPPKVATSA
jgi:high-affinity iron transporter